MDKGGTLPPEAAETTAARPAGGHARAGAGIRWRHDLLAGLVAGVAFLLLITLATTIGAGFVWPAGILFLPVGFWVGRHSRRPWADGAVYGLAAAVLAVLVLLAGEFPLGALFSLFVVLPQGLVGAWAGARLWPAAAIRSPQGRPPEARTPPPTPPES